MQLRRKSTVKADLGRKQTLKSLKISKKDQDRLKVRTINVHDKVLDAVNEQQPFEEANQAHNVGYSLTSVVNNTKNFKDVFGNPITRPDVSNPTRPRDERPMDTIRSFEYSITNDSFYKQNLDTPVYGWSVRPTFALNQPSYASNPYNNYTQESQPRTQPRPVEQAVYQKPPAVIAKKKKKGLFRRSSKV